ncbi:MAG: hypothetical protein VCE74_10235, partial [Alphaproteobacteria bacterium]
DQIAWGFFLDFMGREALKAGHGLGLGGLANDGGNGIDIGQIRHHGPGNQKELSIQTEKGPPSGDPFLTL